MKVNIWTWLQMGAQHCWMGAQHCWTWLQMGKMVAGYFRDMDKVIEKLSISVKNGGFFTMDIGDSQFAGVHIPTHQILSEICSDYGFRLYDEEVLRQRHSKNGMILSQRLLRYRLEK